MQFFKPHSGRKEIIMDDHEKIEALEKRVAALENSNQKRQDIKAPRENAVHDVGPKYRHQK